MRMRDLARALAARGSKVTAVTLAGTVGGDILQSSGIVVHEIAEAAGQSGFRAAAARHDPHVAVIDTLDTDRETIAALHAAGALVVSFDDCAAGLTDADAVINAIVFHWHRYRRDEVRAGLYEGPQYMILSPDVCGRLPSRYSVTTGSRRVLIAIGGTDTRGLTPNLLRALDGVSEQLQIRVNLGPGVSAAVEHSLVNLRSHHRTEVIRAAHSLADEFLGADLVLCGGGNMLYELAALGVPAAAIATEEHEVLNIAYWREHGTIEDLGHWARLDAVRVAGTVNRLLVDGHRRDEMSQAGPRRIDGRGLDRCLEILDRLAA